MYNTDLPRRADLPTSAQLKRSTIIAAATAAALLVTVVMPSEYAIDPIGTGRLLGLTTMGEIKTQLAAESAKDAATQSAGAPGSSDVLARMDRIERLLVAMNGRQDGAIAGVSGETTGAVQAAAQDPLEVLAASASASESVAVVEDASAQQASPAIDVGGRQDEMSFTLEPGQGVEVKMAMAEGAVANYAWSVDGGVVNFSTHGEGGDQKITYGKGRAVPGEEGEITAAFAGDHGWFWRNRGDVPVSVTLRTSGAYATIERKA